MTNEAIKNRLSKLKDAKKEALKMVDSLHVRLQRGNRKTERGCWGLNKGESVIFREH